MSAKSLATALYVMGKMEEMGIDIAATNELPRASEAEALASLREFALGPIGHIFTWSEAATVLELIEMLTKGGIIEVAIRNPSVSEYMAHWEGRAERAEKALELAAANPTEGGYSP